MQCKTDKELVLKQEDNIVQLENETNEMQVDNPPKYCSYTHFQLNILNGTTILKVQSVLKYTGLTCILHNLAF